MLICAPHALALSSAHAEAIDGGGPGGRGEGETVGRGMRRAAGRGAGGHGGRCGVDDLGGYCGGSVVSAGHGRHGKMVICARIENIVCKTKRQTHEFENPSTSPSASNCR